MTFEFQLLLIFISIIIIISGFSNSVGELVKNGENGLVFKDATELSAQLIEWFSGFPHKEQTQFEKHIKAFQSVRWHQNWIQQALHIFK